MIARVRTAGSDGSSDAGGDDTRGGAEVGPSQPVALGQSEEARGTTGTGARGGQTRPAAPTLAAPEGVCAPADVAVAPSVANGQVAGRDVVLSLSLQTRESEACTWQVSADSLTVRVAQDGRTVWSTQQCRRVVPEQSVVVRKGVATVVELTWNARESNEGCRVGRAEWVRPGEFTIAAAALGGEPADAEFALAKPAPETIEVTPEKQDEKGSKKKPKTPKTPTN